MSISKKNNTTSKVSGETKKMNYNQLKNPYGIKTPTNVDEFRENLKKYYMSFKEDGEYQLFTHQDVDEPIYISEISSVQDLIDRGVTKITPLIGFKDNDVLPCLLEWVERTKEGRNFTDFITNGFGFFKDESNFELYKGFEELCKGTGGKPSWYSWESFPLIGFYYITLGRFCGWDFDGLETHLTNKRGE